MSLTDDIRNLADQIKAKADAIDAQQGGGDPPPPSPTLGTITFPQANQVFHRRASDSRVDFTATKSGGGSFRIKNGATVVAESATGVFTNIPMGWYSLVLFDGASESAPVKFGVGSNGIPWGQSNAIANREPGEESPTIPREGLVIIGVLNEDGTGVVYKDVFHEQVDLGLTWQLLALELRQRPGLDVPYCFTPCGLGATNAQTLAAPPHITKFANAISLVKPGYFIAVHGEANAEMSREQAVYDAYATVVNTASNLAPGAKWMWWLNDHAHDRPGGGHWDVALIQEEIRNAYTPNVVWGIDISRMHKPYPLPQILGREHGEVHPNGARRALIAQLAKQRIVDAPGLNI